MSIHSWYQLENCTFWADGVDDHGKLVMNTAPGCMATCQVVPLYPLEGTPPTDPLDPSSAKPLSLWSPVGHGLVGWVDGLGWLGLVWFSWLVGCWLFASSDCWFNYLRIGRLRLHQQQMINLSRGVGQLDQQDMGSWERLRRLTTNNDIATSLPD